MVSCLFIPKIVADIAARLQRKIPMRIIEISQRKRRFSLLLVFGFRVRLVLQLILLDALRKKPIGCRIRRWCGCAESRRL